MRLTAVGTVVVAVCSAMLFSGWYLLQLESRLFLGLLGLLLAVAFVIGLASAFRRDVGDP